MTPQTRGVPRREDVIFRKSLKLEAASLVLDQGYTVLEACASINVGDTALRRWGKQALAERQGEVPHDETLVSLRTSTGNHASIVKSIVDRSAFQPHLENGRNKRPLR